MLLLQLGVVCRGPSHDSFVRSQAFRVSSILESTAVEFPQKGEPQQIYCRKWIRVVTFAAVFATSI